MLNKEEAGSHSIFLEETPSVIDYICDPPLSGSKLEDFKPACTKF